MKNIDINNKKAITVSSAEAHLIFRHASLLSRQSDQYQQRECVGKMDIQEQLPHMD